MEFLVYPLYISFHLRSFIEFILLFLSWIFSQNLFIDLVSWIHNFLIELLIFSIFICYLCNLSRFIGLDNVVSNFNYMSKITFYNRLLIITRLICFGFCVLPKSFNQIIVFEKSLE